MRPQSQARRSSCPFVELDEVGLSSSGSDEAGPMPSGSAKAGPMPSGSVDACLTPRFVYPGIYTRHRYIFFVTLLSIPESSFNVAFKMFDLDHNGYVIFQLLEPVHIHILQRLLCASQHLVPLFSYFNLITSSVPNCKTFWHFQIHSFYFVRRHNMYLGAQQKL